ncbi:MAG: alpha/beta fold hydrolase, partial [Chloroflexi bacterium]|nr:alpha/beta fold hydrolase [Chloroflexota bacterium]
MPQLSIHGASINYRLVGNGEPLVMIAGLGSDHLAWGLQVNAFRRDYRCLTFDNRGSGRSGSGDGEFSIPLFAEDTAALMDELGIGSAHILGTSMGGAIALELALRHPDRVRSLSLNASWPKTDRYLKEILEVLIDIAGGATPDPATLRRLIYLYSFTPSYFDERDAEYETMLRAALEQPFDAQAFVKQARACLNHDVND